MLGRLSKRAVAAVAAIGLWSAGAGSADAQYGSSFYYENPRTGFSYSHDHYVGRGQYYQSFGYRSPSGGYSSRYGYARSPSYGYGRRGYAPYRRRCW